MNQANSFGINDGKFVVIVDKSYSESCDTILDVKHFLDVAFSNGAMIFEIKRVLPDLPRLTPKNKSGVVFISPEG